MAGTADEIAAYLAAFNAGALGLTLTVNLFTTPFPLAADALDTPCVFIHVYGGKPNQRGFGVGPNPPLSEHPEFHLFVRSGRDDDANASALATQIYKALDNLGPTTLSGVAYRDVKSMYGEPKFYGRDANQRPIYVLTFEADKNQS